MFCQQCGSRCDPGARFCKECGAKLPEVAVSPQPVAQQSMVAGKTDLLREIEAALAQNQKVVVSHGQKSDLEISGSLANAGWALGKKKVEYSARVLLKEIERTVVFWEIVKESGWGIPTFGGFKVETYKTTGNTRAGMESDEEFGPTGKSIDYDWDYAVIRNAVKNVAQGRGWKFNVVLLPGKAQR